MDMSQAFGVLFVGSSFPVPGTAFTQTDPTHWVSNIVLNRDKHYRHIYMYTLILTYNLPVCIPT